MSLESSSFEVSEMGRADVLSGYKIEPFLIDVNRLFFSDEDEVAIPSRSFQGDRAPRYLGYDMVE